MVLQSVETLQKLQVAGVLWLLISMSNRSAPVTKFMVTGSDPVTQNSAIGALWLLKEMSNQSTPDTWDQ